MTTQKTFKHRVRARMAKTGESYTAARRQLIGDGDQPDPGPPAFEPLVAEERMVEATGHGHDEWFARLDAWDATNRTHTEIARWLVDDQGVPGWWAQSITVSYERARGRRAPGQRADGRFVATASKTIAVAVDDLFDAVADPARRARWLPDVEPALRTATKPKSARFDWEDGTRLVVTFDAKAPAKATVYVSHEKLPDAATADAVKPYWRAALADLKAVLESGEP